MRRQENKSSSISGMRIILLLFFSSTILFGQVLDSGNLILHVDSLINAMPATSDADDYAAPDSAARSTWRIIIQDILAENFSTAHTAALTLSYQVVELSDTTTTPSIRYYILERTSDATSNFWGTFIYNTSADRAQLFIQVPHPLIDTNTGGEGIHFFRYLGARAYFVSGAHRCNSTTYSACDGTTTACSETPENFRISDQAHVNLGTLQITTEEMEAEASDLVVIQPHGFGQEEGDPDLILSNGTPESPTTDLLATFKSNLTILDSSLSYKIAHEDLAWTRLTGTTNMQGRYMNGISDPCSTAAEDNTAKFIHMEQAYNGLRNNSGSWNKVMRALAMTFPIESTVSNVHTLEFDGINDYVRYGNDYNLQKLDGASDYTLETWMYIEDANDIDQYDIIFMREEGFQLRLKNNLVVSFGIYRGSATWSYYNSADNALNIGQWNHLVVMRDSDANTFKIYVNGADVLGGSYTGWGMQADGGDLYVGRWSTDTQHFKGYLDELRFKNSYSYIENLQTSTSSEPYIWDGSTAALFHFDEGLDSSVTRNAVGHYANLGDDSAGDAAEPTWRTWNYLAEDLSLPVTLTSFVAESRHDDVFISWTVDTELDALGYELYRSTSKTGEYTMITDFNQNPDLLAAGSTLIPQTYSFTDPDVMPGQSYWYQLADVAYNGNKFFHDPISIVTRRTIMMLSQNSPNPFNPQTNIKYELRAETPVRLIVFDISGRPVQTLIAEEQQVGKYSVIWNGFDSQGHQVSAGTYFARLQAGNYSKTIKMMYLR